jgi:germination protein M
MKKLNKKHALMFSVPLIIIGSVFSVVKLSNSRQDDFHYEFVIDMSEKNYRKVYLLDENQYLVPLSIDVSKKEYLVDEIYTVVSNLRDLNVTGFNTTLPEDVKINHIELENGILNIDFSKEFLAYQKQLEEKIIESLTWSVLDFKEVSGLTISVEGKKLEQMPLNGLVLPSILNKDIGINKYHDLTSNYQSGDSVVVMYQKDINGKVYYVPVTRRINIETNKVNGIMKALNKDISILSGLNEIPLINDLSMNNISLIDNKVSVNLDETYLVEDNMIDPDVYKLLMVMLEYNNLDIEISFYINNESVEVMGYNSDSDKVVSQIIFNEIKL